MASRIRSYGGSITGDHGNVLRATYLCDWGQRVRTPPGQLRLLINPIDAPDWIVSGGLTDHGDVQGCRVVRRDGGPDHA